MKIVSSKEDDQEIENYISEDEGDANEEKYAKLQAAITGMDNNLRIRSADRNELGALISEFHVREKAPNALVQVNELASSLGEKDRVSKIKKKIKNVTSKTRTLPKPLEKPLAEQIKRKIGFEIVKEQLKSWDAVVESHRVADHLVFPINEGKFSVRDEGEFFDQYVTQTPLEKELNAVLHGAKPEQKKEEKDEFPLTLEEMIERRKELAGIRAKQSYREAKAYRQSKIKSKKYHRIQKREKVKQQMKEFELLQKTDPEAALKKLEELERSRAEERATLRHRSTGKWAKNLAVRAKYDKESRKVLAEQLSISRDMTTKAKQVDSSDDEGELNPTVLKTALEIAESNPWSLELSSDVNSFISGFRKYWSDKNDNKPSEEKKETPNPEPEPIKATAEKRQATKPSKGNENPEPEPTTVTTKKRPAAKSSKGSEEGKKMKLGACSKWTVTPVATDSHPLRKKVTDLDLDEAFYLADEKLAANISKKFKVLSGKIKPAPAGFQKRSVKKKKTSEPSLKMKHSRWHVDRAQVDQELGDTTMEDQPSSLSAGRSRAERADSPVEVNPSQINIDPDKFIKVAPKSVNTPVPEDVAGGDDDALDEDEQQQVIMEAFADDNVVDFKKAKEDAEKETQPEVVTELPGWGSWGGVGVSSSKRRRRRFLKLPTLPARKDHGRPDIIINEEANPKVKNHMVKEVPFPFKSVSAFESNIRTPISREWVPEQAHRDLIRPPIITRQGTIIEPLSEDVLLRNKPKYKSVFKGKVKAKPVKDATNIPTRSKPKFKNVYKGKSNSKPVMRR